MGALARQVAPGEWVKSITIELKNELEEDLGLDQALSACHQHRELAFTIRRNTA